MLTEWKKTLNYQVDETLFFVYVSHLHALVCVGLIDHVSREGVIECMQILGIRFLPLILT